jgi:small G protein signaling modulator 3
MPARVKGENNKPDRILDHPSRPTSQHILEGKHFLCNAAFTEAAYVGSHFDAFAITARRLAQEGDYRINSTDYCYQGRDSMTMDQDVTAQLERTVSQCSATSAKSQRSHTLRSKPRKFSPYVSSSASSISDKSLTSFPSFSPESPRDARPLPPSLSEGTAKSSRHLSNPSSIVESLTTPSPSKKSRTALFDDSPLGSKHLPGALHYASDEHIERLIARNGAVALVRQVAEDLAHRDAQISSLRRKAEERERALRKIILECGLSTLDLETRLRVIEDEQKANDTSNRDLIAREDALQGMMHDAMSDTVVFGDLDLPEADATIRASDALKAIQANKPAKAPAGWKEYIWGSGTTRKISHPSSISGETVNGVKRTISPKRSASTSGRPTVLESAIFQPPDTARSTSRPPSVNSGTTSSMARDRKPSSGLAAFAMKLVAGNITTSRDSDDSDGRGRANSTGSPGHNRTVSSASSRTTKSAMAAPPKPAAKSISVARKLTPNQSLGARTPQQDRWDTMAASPQKAASGENVNNYGPVEMDTILPPDAQPPTVMQMYNNAYSTDYLTDRFGFIYDQRRKKRQKEAAERTKRSKRSSRVEMLSGARSGVPLISPDKATSDLDDDRPDTPTSTDERGEDGKPKRWQDYLKIATFPTELLSHTPSAAVPAFEVMEGGELPPRSPGITSEERGFVPSAGTTAASPALSVPSHLATISKPTVVEPLQELTSEDAEPVKLLLKQLGEVHDSLQREKTVKWNDFLRKVRAERKRDGEAAAAALAADTRSLRPMALMPEASLADGEIVGVAGLGNKGKVGRAKWNEFKMLVLGGIPVSYRAKIWAECSGAAALRIPGYYDDLIGQRDNKDDPAIVAQIQMDINRTLTDNIFFRKGPGVQKLSEVLLAYSRRNAEVGYCQGMNLITACLLLIMPTAEDTFWVLTSIIENILPRGYYDHSLLASRADQQVLRQYVGEILPKLSLHLDELNIELEALTFQWFLSVFTDCLSAEALFRVWDVVFCTNDGSTFLFQVALALLKLNEVQLLQCSTPASIYTYINHQMTNHAISIDGLIHASEGLRKMVRRDDVESRRARAIEAEKDLVRQREARNHLRRAERIAAASLEPQAEMSIDTVATSEENAKENETAELNAETTISAEGNT